MSQVSSLGATEEVLGMLALSGLWFMTGIAAASTYLWANFLSSEKAMHLWREERFYRCACGSAMCLLIVVHFSLTNTLTASNIICFLSALVCLGIWFMAVSAVSIYLSSSEETNMSREETVPITIIDDTA
jgi:uncharacterized membrane protein